MAVPSFNERLQFPDFTEKSTSSSAGDGSEELRPYARYSPRHGVSLHRPKVSMSPVNFSAFPANLNNCLPGLGHSGRKKVGDLESMKEVVEVDDGKVEQEDNGRAGGNNSGAKNVEGESGGAGAPGSMDPMSARGGRGCYNRRSKWPENELIVVAFWLAILEKAASLLGVMGFIWATVVLLGGFASDVKPIDFWFVTIILVVQGTRIFSRSHELQWQHHRALSGDGILSRITGARLNEGQNNPDVTWLHYLPRIISGILYHLQFLSSIACAVLSLYRLIKGDYSSGSLGAVRNLKPALTLFYCLVFSEAAVSIGQKIYSVCKFTFLKVLEQVNKNCGFSPNNNGEGGGDMEHFFYYVYARCINGHTLDGLQADMVGFATELLLTDKPDQQLRGARILCKFTGTSSEEQRLLRRGRKLREFTDQRRLYSLRKIGTSSTTMERLMEMLGWENSCKELRISAAKIVMELAGTIQIAHRLANIPGCMESVSSLLSDEGIDEPDLGLSILGLQILVKISEGGDNRDKIGNKRGLLQTIINFTTTNDRLLTGDKLSAVDLALQLLYKLARTHGPIGAHLRGEIVKNVFIASNLDSILRRRAENNKLEILNNAIDILKYLAMDNEEARGKIGSTGRIINELLKLFLEDKNPRAGKALFLLSLDHTNNCKTMMSIPDTLSKLLDALKTDENQDTTNGDIIIYLVNILLNLCNSAPHDHHADKVKIANDVWEIVMNGILNTQKELLLQSFLGFGAAIFEATKFENLGHEKRDLLMKRIVDLLRTYKHASSEVPNIRRYSIELAILIMKSHGKSIETFKSKGFFEVLRDVSSTTSELESFYMFSGSIGLNRHSITTHELIQRAINCLSKGS